MSRIGKNPKNIPAGVDAKFENGVMTDRQARNENVGGEVLAYIW